MTVAVRTPYGLPPPLTDAINKLCTDTSVISEIVTLSYSEGDDNNIKALNDTTKIPFLYDPSPLKGNVPKFVPYLVKRLLKGLATLSPTTRLNYATALYAIICEHNVQAEVMYEWVQVILEKGYISNQMKMSSSEELAIFTGRLVAFKIILNQSPSKDLAQKICKDILEIWSKKDNLNCLAISVLVSLVKIDIKGLSKVIEEYCVSFEATNPGVIKMVGLVLALRNKGGMTNFGKSSISNCHCDFKKSIDWMPLFSMINVSNLDNPTVYTLLTELLEHLTDDLNSFTSAWKILIDSIPIDSKIGKSVIVRVVVDFFYNSSPDLKMVLLTDRVLEIICSSESPLSNLTSIISGDQKIACYILLHLIKSNKIELAFELISSQNLVIKPSSLLQDLSGSKWNEKEEIRFADFHISLLKPGSVIPSTDVIASLVNFIADRFESRVTVEKLSGRLQGALVRVLEEDKLSIQDLFKMCLIPIYSYYDFKSENGKLNFESLDDPVKDAWKSSLSLSKKLDKSMAAGERENPLLRPIHLIALAGTLFLILEPIVSASIFEDLTECFNSLSKPSITQNDNNVDPVNVLLDILLQWLSQSSALLRHVADNVFSMLVPHLKNSSLELIKNVLSSKFTQEESDLMEYDELDDDDNDSGADDDSDKSSDRSDDGDDNGNNQHHDISEMEMPEDDNDSDSSSVIDIDEADSAELDLLDSHLSAIMTARKQHNQAAEMSRQKFFHFKLRVLSWLEIINKDSDGHRLFLRKVHFVPSLLKGFSIHKPSEGEIFTRWVKIFKLFYQCKTTSQTLNQEDITLCKNIASEVLNIVSDSMTNRLLLSNASITFWFIISSVKDGSFLDDLHEPLLVLWLLFIKNTEKRHNSDLLSFFERMRNESPKSLLSLASSETCLMPLTKARLQTREKVIRFIDPAIKKVSEKEIGNKFFKSLTTVYCDGFDLMFRELNVSQFLKELSLLNFLVSKSRPFFGDQVFALWNPLLEKINMHVDTLRGSLQNNQVQAIKSRLNSMLAMVQCPSI